MFFALTNARCILLASVSLRIKNGGSCLRRINQTNNKKKYYVKKKKTVCEFVISNTLMSLAMSSDAEENDDDEASAMKIKNSMRKSMRSL